MTSPTTEQNLYRYESDPCILVNLETPDVELLKSRQQQLQKKIAQFTTDLTVITEAIANQLTEK